MNIRFFNARILTMESQEVFEGELWTSGKTIAAILKKGESREKIVFDREIDCCGNLMMPGFKNAHSHVAMTFARSFSDNLPLDRWLNEKIFPMEGKLTDESTYWFTKIGLAEYARAGVTGFFDMYFNLDAITRASKEIGLRDVMCGSVNDFGGIDRLENEYEKYNDDGDMISYRLGFHAEYTTSESIMKRISEIAHKYEAPVYAHNSETRSEVEGCISRYGCTPTEIMDKLGMFDFGGGGFHVVWMSENDHEIFRNRGLDAVFNFGSNLKLASGVADVQRFIDDGVNIAIGTDGAGSNNSLNMFREMYMASVVPKVEKKDASAIDPYLILRAATLGGSKAMGLSENGLLKEGWAADIIMIDMHAPSMQPVNSIVPNLVYSGDSGIVKMTMVAGNIIYENGSYSGIDLEETYAKCNELMKTF